jgi:hypothetical protein
MQLCLDKTMKWRAVRWSLLACVGLLCVSMHRAFSENASQRFPVTPEMVVAAMKYRQLPIEGVQVRLAAPITSSAPNPMLDIQTMTRIDDHNAQLRFACRVRPECLPFYVAVTWPTTAASVTVPGPLAREAGLVRGTGQHSETPANGAMRRGSTATLLIEDEKVHIRLRVICLEGGVTGDRVRVATPDRKVAYNAEIVAPNLLKGGF